MPRSADKTRTRSSNPEVTTRDIVVVGASAGGVEALIELVASFPEDLAAAVFVVLHMTPEAPSVLPRILNRNGFLPAEHAKNGEAIRHGRIYVAPPNHHLLVIRDVVRTSLGPRENGARPAVDPLFRSAARAYGTRVIAAVLSGLLDDGTAGLEVVKRRGGLALVQDPEEALYDGMPRSAIENVDVDEVLTLERMGARIVELAGEPIAEGGSEAVSDLTRDEGTSELELTELQSEEDSSPPSGYVCPECNGSLYQIEDGNLLRFRCRVGHAYSSDSLLAEQRKGVEAALWTALRALEESSALANRLRNRASDRGDVKMAARFQEQALEAETRAAVLRDALLSEGTALPEVPEPEMVPSGSPETGEMTAD